MVMIVFTAFVGTGIAHIGTEYHKLPHEFGIAGGETRAHFTKIGAIAAKPDAVAHHLNVIFLQTGRSAVFAGGSTIKTNLNMPFVLLHRFHTVISWFID